MNTFKLKDKVFLKDTIANYVSDHLDDYEYPVTSLTELDFYNIMCYLSFHLKNLKLSTITGVVDGYGSEDPASKGKKFVHVKFKSKYGNGSGYFNEKDLILVRKK